MNNEAIKIMIYTHWFLRVDLNETCKVKQKEKLGKLLHAGLM